MSFYSIITYVTRGDYLEDVKANKSIACLILSKELVGVYSNEATGRNISYIVTSDAEESFYSLHELIVKDDILYEKYDFTPIIGDNCHISDTAKIENGVTIGNRVFIGHHTVINFNGEI